MLTIKTYSGTDILAVEPGSGSRRVYTLMSEDYVTLRFSLATPVHFMIGSYVDVPSFVGEGTDRYELTDLYQPSLNAKTGGWDYDIRFDAHYIKWKNKIFKYIPDNAYSNVETSWSLTASLAVHLQIFLRNLAALGFTYRGTAYTFAIDTTVAADARCITYESKTLLDALYQMAETFECEVWVQDNEICFGRCEFGDAVAFSQDVNVETMTAESSRATYATRLYAFGSDRNLPSGYRQGSQSLTVGGVVQRRLMLPASTPYIDAYSGLTSAEAVEAVAIFDDIYPRTQSPIADVSIVTYDEQDEEGNPTGATWEAYRFTIPGFTFSESYILAGEDLQAEFQTGLLAGMTFSVKFNPEGLGEDEDGCQLWEVIRSEDYGRPLPDSTLRPSAGDKVVIIGWDSTMIGDTSLIEAAEQELKARAQSAVEKLKTDPANYRCRMISAAMFDAGGIWHPYTVGSRVTLINAGCFALGSRASRIIGYEYDLARPFSSPTYLVGEKSGGSRLTDIESKVEALTLAGQTYTAGGNGVNIYVIRTNDLTPASDTNVYSALRTKRDFLSRIMADVALGKITFADGLAALKKATFEGGVQLGQNFASGLTGMGGYIDPYANAELESLTLRSWLEVPEIRFNRAEVLLGDQWQAPGGGIVESVVPDVSAGEVQPTGTITLKLEEGEIGAVAVDDICKGYFHDFKASSSNATADTDDSRGNTTFAGFCTVFFRITELLNDDGTAVTEGQQYEGRSKKFRYALRPVSESWRHQFHPYEQMHFVAYGSFTRADRQRSAYQTRTYTRFLKGVDGWEFSQSNIAMQFGDLQNLSVFGMDMEGYSAYMQNLYFTGTVKRLDLDFPVELEVTTNTGDFLIASGETLTVTCTVMRGWDLTDYAKSWSVTRDSGDSAADAAWNASHPMYSPMLTLTQEDVGATAFSASSLFTFTATGESEKGNGSTEQWTASRTVAVRILRIQTSLAMRFVSEYGEYDTYVGYGDTVRFQALIEDGLRNDYTSDYDQWRIERRNGDTADDIASDGVWNVTRAAISSSGAFSIEWSAEHDDLQAERATFIITAQKGSRSETQISGTLSI